MHTPLLRERWFGELDGLPLKNYNQVWPRDLVSAQHAHRGVEAVDEVCARIRELVLSLEAEREGELGLVLGLGLGLGLGLDPNPRWSARVS